MHEMKMSLEKLKKAKECLLGWVTSEIDKGKSGVTAEEVAEIGQLVDMIKDFAETEEKCVKAKYYEELIKMLKEEGQFGEDEDEEGPFGYDNWRYSSGRFAPKGRGHYTGGNGYTPMRGRYHLHAPEFREDITMGYDGGNSSSDSSGSDGRSGNGRMGYYPMMDMIPSKFGTAYDEYKMAKRSYSESKNPEDSRKMDEKMKESVTNTVECMVEMWEDADPEMRKKIKMHFAPLMEKMSKG